MHLPFSREASAAMARQTISDLKIQFGRFYHQPWFWKAMAGVPYMAKVSQLAQQLIAAEKQGNKMIGYYSDLHALKLKLDELSMLSPTADPKGAGDAFGAVLMQAGEYLGSTPPPFNAYATPLKELGKNLGKIVYMMTPQHRLEISGYGKREGRQLLFNPNNTKNW